MEFPLSNRSVLETDTNPGLNEIYERRSQSTIFHRRRSLVDSMTTKSIPKHHQLHHYWNDHQHHRSAEINRIDRNQSGEERWALLESRRSLV